MPYVIQATGQLPCAIYHVQLDGCTIYHVQPDNCPVYHMQMNSLRFEQVCLTLPPYQHPTLVATGEVPAGQEMSVVTFGRCVGSEHRL